MDFAPIDRDTCPGCGRPTEAWYKDRKFHMAILFQQGIPVPEIAAAYRMGPDYAMSLIKDQLGEEAVYAVIMRYRKEGVTDAV